jgi:hypothetical protein
MIDPTGEVGVLGAFVGAISGALAGGLTDGLDGILPGALEGSACGAVGFLPCLLLEQPIGIILDGNDPFNPNCYRVPWEKLVPLPLGLKPIKPLFDKVLGKPLAEGILGGLGGAVESTAKGLANEYL